MSLAVSLVIPVFNESNTIRQLLETIRAQHFQPAEVILVDGGSTDNTVQLIREFITQDNRFRIVEAGRAMPGKGRNLGTQAAINEWIAYTDAGITLDKHWLEKLVLKAGENPSASVIFGNFSPQIHSFFDKCASISYVPPMIPGKIRTRAVPSCLLKKEVWESAGGFPDWRAAEDLVFMEKIEKQGYRIEEEPAAMIYWELRPGLLSTFKKFQLYSMYNVWAGRQAYWHYGVARQYIMFLLCMVAAVFFGWYWLLLIPAWMGARVAKRVWAHRHEFGARSLFNPLLFFMVLIITLVLDMATFSGWIKALTGKRVLTTSTA